MKRLFLVILSLPASVIAFNFAQGVVEYWAGTGVLRTMGYPGFEFENLDPTSRAHSSTGGCIRSKSACTSSGAKLRTCRDSTGSDSASSTSRRPTARCCATG